jgi:pyruvate/2-oxoglutarate dehydrogenase complex dihydrolipoamide dehydrogenase (E3) component
MADHEFDLGIIGAGAAGLTAAAGAAQFGAKVLLVEKEPELGGDCLHFGCVPSKTLIKTAKVLHLMKTAGRFGLPEVEVPAVDFASVSARIRSVIETIQEHDSDQRFCGLGVEVVHGGPVFIDPHTVELEGAKKSARSWLISTGSSPAVPPLEGLDRVDFLTNKELFFLEELPKSMIILGAGPIAMEMAQAFNRLGTKVRVIQRGDQILSREDKDLADLVLQALRSEGVEVHLGCKVERVDQKEGVKEVTVQENGRQSTFRADALLVALGRRPNTAGLGLTRIGVELDKGAVKVDDRLRSALKHIYAAGDATGRYLFTHAAGYEGGIALTNAIVRLPRKADYTFLPWCTYTEPELASIGLNEKAAAQAGIKVRVWTEEFKANDRGLAEGRPEGLIKLLLDEKEKPVGIQILGMNAGDLVAEWVAALNGKVKLSTLAGAIHPYPTLAEINKRVAGNYLAPKIFSEKVKKGLKLFFHLKGRACEVEG